MQGARWPDIHGVCFFLGGVEKPLRRRGGFVTNLVGLGVSVLRVVLLVGLRLCVLLRLLGLLVLLLVVHRLLFLRGGREKDSR